MSNLQTQWSEAELLATETVVEPLVVEGIRCHGGFDAAGNYVSPRTKYRVPATAAWQQAHREAFGTEIIDAPLATWPASYPDVAQAKYLLSEGVRGPIVTTLTRIGTVEGFGAMIRGLGPGDIQRFFVESIDGTCLAHLQRGLFEAQARDEAGWGGVAGHRDMWFAARRRLRASGHRRRDAAHARAHGHPRRRCSRREQLGTVGSRSLRRPRPWHRRHGALHARPALHRALRVPYVRVGRRGALRPRPGRRRR